MKNWFMSILSLAGAAVTIFEPQLQHVISSHPSIFASIAAAIGVISHVLPSPTGAVIDQSQK